MVFDERKLLPTATHPSHSLTIATLVPDVCLHYEYLTLLQSCVGKTVENQVFVIFLTIFLARDRNFCSLSQVRAALVMEADSVISLAATVVSKLIELRDQMEENKDVCKQLVSRGSR